VSFAQQFKENKGPRIASLGQVAQSLHFMPKSVPVLITIILLIHVALLLDCMGKNFVTVDEAGHLVAGISHWTTGTYSMYRVNPPLPRMLAVLPVLLLHPNTQGIQPTPALGERAEWRCANQFALDNASRYLDILFVARLAGILWSCLGGWLVFRWASDLYSYRAGILGLVFWCFDPNILANAQMVTPDVPATVAGLAAMYCFWRYLRWPSWNLALIAGLVLGIAQLTKFTLLYLYALWPLLWLLYRWQIRTADTSYVSFWVQIWHGLLMAIVSLVIINLGYECQETCNPLGKYVFVSRTLGGEPSPDVTHAIAPINRFRDSWLGSLPVPVPAEFLAGIDRQKFDFERGWHSYLRGEWRYGGWWYYYLYGLAVKMPLGIISLIVCGLIATLVRYPCRIPTVDECFLWLPVLIVLVLVSSQTGFNHHLRYVLPIFPFAFLGASKLAYFLSFQHWKTGFIVLLLAMWSMTSTLLIHPHYLSYFNEAAGGAENGHYHLIDSNIDWGQDLLFLKAWLDQYSEARPLGLAYYNVVDPRIVGICFTLPPPGQITGAQNLDASEPGPRPGYYALDVNFIRGSSFIAADGKGRFRHIPMHQYEYFQHFQPIAKAGYSIYIYHITLDEANRVRRALGLPLLRDVNIFTENKP
jgi:hypothetical protein